MALTVTGEERRTYAPKRGGGDSTPFRYDCNLTANGDDYDTEVYAVHDTSETVCSEGEGYCVWGTDATGASFCCETKDYSFEQFNIYGQDNEGFHDEIYLHYVSGGTEYNLEANGTVTFMQARVFGRSGDDEIEGSRDEDADYEDVLHGDDGGDTIEGLQGDDTITGDNGIDTLIGGPGDDTILGGANSDTIQGNAGIDTIDGGSDQDNISGGSDVDVIHGDGGADTICGDGGTETLYGDADGDVIWGGVSTDGDTIYGGAGVAVDTCYATTTYGCEVVGSSTRPAACPGP